MEEALWTPEESYISDSGIFAYQAYLSKAYNLSFTSYQSLHDWSIAHPDIFWESILKYFDVSYSGSYTDVFSWDKNAGDFTDVKWFPGMRLSYAAQLFKNRPADGIAVYYQDEQNNDQSVTWSTLEKRVAALQQYLRAQGVQRGDRVVGVLSNNIAAIEIFLAVNTLGAVWSCCSPDFGDKSIVERFNVIAPKLLFIESEYQYNGKRFDKQETLQVIKKEVNSLSNVITVGGPDWTSIFDNYSKQPLTFVEVPFDHPIWILYSSGTTGTPKAITHRTGGMLLEHLKALVLHQNVKEGERFLWYTTTGWMMWNYALSSLLCGASLCLFDGAIQHNNHQTFWNFVKRVKVDHLGAGAAYYSSIHSLEIADFQPKVVGSTGSPLPAATFKKLQQKFPETQIISLSGGTDVCSAFLSGCAYLPVYAGEIQCITLGSDIVAINDEGVEVIDEVGELLIKQPMPSMPVFFWNDTENEKYKASYFSAYPGRWSHGDWITIASHGGVTMHGRSDATLNRAGVRIGTAEIYNAVQQLESVRDSLVITQDQTDGSAKMILFLQLKDAGTLANVQPKLIATLRRDYTARHVPDLFFEVPDIPYTRSGKKLEIPVKKIFSGKALSDAVSKDVVRNPDSLLAFSQIYEQLPIDNTP